MILSPRFVLVNEDVKKILAGALIAGIGAVLTYITEQIPNVNLGEFTPLVVAFWSILANTVKKFLTESVYKPTGN